MKPGSGWAIHAVFMVAHVVLAPQLQAAAAKPRLSELLRRPPEWFRSPEAGQFASNILTFQSEQGGWPKNTDTVSRPYEGRNPASDLRPAFDNGATTDELRFLAAVFSATENPRFRKAFDKGLRYVMDAQYPNGGWPQFHPPRPGSYERHITFNDGAMVRILEFLRECHTSPRFAFVPAAERARAEQAFARGIDCILRCQVRLDGRLTAWCAQHDAKDLSPRPARSYELPSLSGAESVGIVNLLMSLEDPGPAVVESVQAAVRWFREARINGIRVVTVPDPRSPRGTDKRVVEDPSAPPMWARFYDLDTNQPFFCDRDGVPKRKLSEIGYERRNGYAWLGYWPAPILERTHPEWVKRIQR